MSSSELRCVLPGCEGRTIALYRLKRFAVEECTRCGMRFRRPLPTADELQRMYEDPVYHASAYFSAQYGQSPRRASPEVRIHADALRWLGGRPDIPAPSARTLLDVGCGTGLFLGMALHHGWRAVGVELSSSLAARAREEMRLDVRCGDFLDVPLPAESFDAITMWDFLEHVLDPARVVEKARGLLKPSGYLVIFTIDTASLFNTIAHLMHRLFGQRAQQPLELLYDARHNYYFTQASLAGLLDGRGLRIESTVSYRAYLGRWLAEPASFGVRLVGDAIDLASVVLRRKYRQLVYCRTAL